MWESADYATRRSSHGPYAYDVEGRGTSGVLANVSAGTAGSGKLTLPRPVRSKPWRSGWHWRRVLLTLLYLCLLASYVVYLYYRIRYTLKEAVNQGDPRNNARYKISPYAIVSVCIEALSMAAMAIYAVNKTYYPSKTWKPPRPMSVKAPFRVVVSVCCYKEPTAVLAGTLAAAAEALREARRAGLIASGTAIWLCDDTPAGKIKYPGHEEKNEASKDCSYMLEGQEFSHNGPRRANRIQMIENLRWAFPDIAFAHRLPTSPVRAAEHNGLNKKSGNLNAALREIWPPGRPVDDRDILVVLDADQAAFRDFLVTMLPAFDAGIDDDNVALVQSPQVFEGVHPVYDVFNHQNVEFWSTLMVAYNTTGFISCAGTNFGIRATALRTIGPSPFPTHTVTEDFALGMRLRANSPHYTGIYLPLQLVKGTAPDTIRAAFKQRSRWTKGPFQMMISSESPFWFSAQDGAGPVGWLSLRDRLCFLAPVFNTLVNCLVTPYFCFVPCFFIWFGRFPAALSLPTIVVATVAMGLSLFFKYFARPSVGVRTVVRQDGVPVVKNGEIKRRTHNYLSYILAEWNADVNIRNFWWLFAKVIINFFLRCCGLRRQSGFSATVGGRTAVFDGFWDVLPLSLLWFILMASVTWAALQLYVGARFLGPLGICMAWAIYQAVPPGAMMCYVLFRVRHEPQKRGCCWCYEHWGRAVFSTVYLGSFVLSWACLILAAVLAVMTLPRQSAFTQNIRTFTDGSGQVVTYHYFFSAKTTIQLLKHNLNSGVDWQWHW